MDSIVIVGVLALLVLIVSLYDFFSSRSWQQVTSAARNEVVFDDRNKEYGAYEIRNNYDKTIIFTILGIIVAIGVSYGAYMFVKSLPEEVEEVSFNDFQAEFEMPDEEEEIIEEPEDPIPPVELETQLDFREFVVTDEEVDTQIVSQEQVEDTRAGSQTVDNGNEGFTEPVIAQPAVVAPPKEEIVTYVEEDAEFPGGYAEMMRFFQKNMKYPEIAVQAGIEGKASLRFVVDKDGSISRVTVVKGVPNCPECDKEAVRVVKAMPKWKPGKVGGKAVTSYYSMPVAFKLQ